MPGLLPIVPPPEARVDPDIPEPPEVRAVEEVDFRLVRVEDCGVE